MAEVVVCPLCERSAALIKAGLTAAGTQKVRCKSCRKTFTPHKKERGYPKEVRQMALKLYLEGNNLRRIGRLLAVNHQSVANWINQYHAHLPAPQVATLPAASRVETVELDELFTFVGDKKSALTS